ncbi:MAG: FAD-dependent oxidoreductase, partial [Luminiphilus sp.]
AATYLQRTADHRLVIGARGHYLPGGKPQHALGDLETIGRHREQIALNLFPQLNGVCFTHNWGGSVGVPRQWHPHIMHNRASGIATAGGYVGEGVGASFLFGQTLADLLTEQDTERTQMPWVRRSAIEELKRWEPEPFPRLGLKATMMAFATEEWLLDRYPGTLPTRLIGWACDQLAPH